MPEVDVLTGKIAKLEYKDPTPDEKALFREFFDILIEELRKMDEELARSYEENYDFYIYALGVAKGYFDKPYGGKNASSGQFGSVLMRPQDAYYSSTTQYNHWKRTLTASSTKQNLFGGGSTDPIKASTTSEKKSVLAFHKLLSYHPSPKLQTVLWTVNRFPYIHHGVEPFSKIPKLGKTFKIIPIPAKTPGGVILHPGGQFYTEVFAEETVTSEIALLGLCFAEYDYLVDEAISWL